MAEAGKTAPSPSPKDAKESPSVNMAEDMKAFRGKHYFRLVVSTAGFVVLAWIFGRIGFGIVWLAPFLVLVFSWWNRTSSEILETTARLADVQARRERAFQNAETAEWLNFIVNRWCVFSDSSILSLIKTSLDPLLEYYKPTFLESIEVEDFTLGSRTPYFKYIECFDSFEDNRKIKASELAMRFPPSDLSRTPKYKAVMDVDLGLASPDSKFVIRVKIAKAALLDLSTDIAVEDFHINGKMQFVFSFNRNIPFPHLAAISLCFLEEPEVEFNIRLLKAVQLMEFPLLKSWVANLVNDCLKLSLVDPGRLTIPLCDDPDVLGHGAQYGCGILTLTIEGGYDGRLTDDVHWCALTLGEQKRQLKEIHHGDEWSDKISILVYSLTYDKLILKMKAKRKLGNKYTVLEYQIPLARLGLDTNGDQEEVFEKSRQRGSKMKVSFEYAPLPVINITNETTEEDFQKNYLDKMKDEENNNSEGIRL
ncbi:tricalbin-1-like isoform X1 [Paramuricea clavata]|uniref:Tricalbin-1-like isoform X1 n=1 Tax=Paramuricea clavata TaxID=317549 RepID=A0A6S7IQ61_PARCT|nr:tricalbin-1-like isoform X1 [Paramuricea clavata]